MLYNWHNKKGIRGCPFLRKLVFPKHVPMYLLQVIYLQVINHYEGRCWGVFAKNPHFLKSRCPSSTLILCCLRLNALEALAQRL